MNDFRSWYGMQPPALRALLTINVVFYILWLIPLRFIAPVEAFIFTHLALIAEPPVAWAEPWQFLTYNFLHLGRNLSGFFHILFNMLLLVWIGRDFEQMQGSHRLLAIYLICGVGGGLVEVLMAMALPGYGGPTYGASGSVFGVMAAVATFYPYQSIGLLFIGTVRLAYFVIGLLAINILFQFGSGVAVGAHIGGALFGYLFAKGEQRGLNLSGWARVFFGERRRKTVVKRHPAAVREQPAGIFGRMEGMFGKPAAEPPGRTAGSRSRQEAEPPPRPGRDATQRELDRILDKISAQGKDSLSEEEKRFLYEASKR